MSGLKPPELSAFYRSLHARGYNCDTLAAKVGVGRASLSRVLNGSRRRGPIWNRVVAHLTPEELKLLDVAHRHPWNRKRLLKRPKWSRVAKRFAPQPDIAA